MYQFLHCIICWLFHEKHKLYFEQNSHHDDFIRCEDFCRVSNNAHLDLDFEEPLKNESKVRSKPRVVSRSISNVSFANSSSSNPKTAIFPEVVIDTTPKTNVQATSANESYVTDPNTSYSIQQQVSADLEMMNPQPTSAIQQTNPEFMQPTELYIPFFSQPHFLQSQSIPTFHTYPISCQQTNPASFILPATHNQHHPSEIHPNTFIISFHQLTIL